MISKTKKIESGATPVFPEQLAVMYYGVPVIVRFLSLVRVELILEFLQCILRLCQLFSIHPVRGRSDHGALGLRRGCLGRGEGGAGGQGQRQLRGVTDDMRKC